LGATAFVNVDSEGNRLGMRARFRRWLNDELTVDVGPGIFFTASEEALHAPGFSGLLSFGTHDAGFVFQAERLLYQDLDDRPPVADWRIHFGLRSRGEAAVGLTMLELLIYGIAAFAGF
jgi:hypothetical protein